MPQPENFLNYFQQTGALNVADPVRSTERATNILGARANIESSQLNSDMKRLEIGKSALKQVSNKEDYQKYRSFMVDRIGMTPELFPEGFNDDNEFTEWKNSALLSADEMSKQQQGQPYTISNKDGTKTQEIQSKAHFDQLVSQGIIKNPNEWTFGKPGTLKSAGAMKTWVTPEGQTISLPNTEAPPQGSIPYSTGLDIDVGPEGTTIRTGVGRGGQTKKTKGAIETKALNAAEGITRLNEIASSFKPEFLQVGTKLKNLKTIWQEKGADTPLAGILGKAKPEDQALLDDYSDFKRTSISNINLYIKEITGAQMSEKEADRIRLGMPDPGEGIFDGDSPTQFSSKWSSTMKSLKLAAARYSYLLNQGVNAESIQAMANSESLPSLSNMEGIITTRDKEIEAEVRAANPDMSKGEIDINVAKQLQQEFGL